MSYMDAYDVNQGNMSMTNPPDQDCRFTGSFVSEGDGVKMLTHCVVHPEFRFYTTTWITTPEQEFQMKRHLQELAVPTKRDLSTPGSPGASEA